MIRKTALIIGGSSGIGRKIAEELSKVGYNIFVTYNNGNIDELKMKCEELGSKFDSYKLDVSDHQQITRFFQENIKKIDYLDCAIYCAGISLDEKLLMDEKDGNIGMILDVNLRGAIYFAKESMKYFSKIKHGNIVFISSIYGLYGGACESVYSASKGGLIALTKAMALECGSFNVRVNCVAPGYIKTRMTEKFNEEERVAIKEETPLKRLGETEDVANTVTFLVSDASSFITGEVITVSGGVNRYN